MAWRGFTTNIGSCIGIGVLFFLFVCLLVGTRLAIEASGLLFMRGPMLVVIALSVSLITFLGWIIVNLLGTRFFLHLYRAGRADWDMLETSATRVGKGALIMFLVGCVASLAGLVWSGTFIWLFFHVITPNFYTTTAFIVLQVVYIFFWAYLQLRLVHILMFIEDQDAGVFESVSKSFRATSGNVFTYFLVFFVFILNFTSLSAVTLGLGFILAMPFMFLVLAALYLQVTGDPCVAYWTRSTSEPAGSSDT